MVYIDIKWFYSNKMLLNKLTSNKFIIKNLSDEHAIYHKFNKKIRNNLLVRNETG